MSGIKIKTPTGVLTVGDLMDYLTEMEASWTDEDIKYMGEFRDHKINIPCFKLIEGTHTFRYVGIGNALIYYHGGLDFIIDENVEYNRARKK